MHLGKNICRVRELLNIRQQTLADLLNVSQQTVSKIEQTEQISGGVIEKIANALGFDANVILYYDAPAIICYLKAREAISGFHHLLQARSSF